MAQDAAVDAASAESAAKRVLLCQKGHAILGANSRSLQEEEATRGVDVSDNSLNPRTGAAMAVAVKGQL